MRDKQIFADPGRKRWKRLRRLFDVTAVVLTLVLIAFTFNVLRHQNLPNLLLPVPRHNYRALPDHSAELRSARLQRALRRRPRSRTSGIVMNSGEGLRSAYYTPDDAASYSSFKEHIHQIDFLFPVWLHIDGPDFQLKGTTDEGHEFAIFSGAAVRDPDQEDKVKRAIQKAKEDTEIYPVLQNFSPAIQDFDANVAKVVEDPAQRARLESQLMRFYAAFPAYHGLSLDLENLPDEAMPGYEALTAELYAQMHPRKLRLYVNLAVSTAAKDLSNIAAHSDGVVLMNYDEHEVSSDAGPIASQQWFVTNLTQALKSVPREKLICAIGSYGYDWAETMPANARVRHFKPKVVNTDVLSVADAWQRAADADADLDLDYDSLNAHYEYVDEDDHQRHIVWFLDAVTVLDEMRAARALGIQTFALWRLGSEDSSLWNIWDKPGSAEALRALGTVPPGHDVDTEGDGDILRVTGTPQAGRRTVTVDTDDSSDPTRQLVVDEQMQVYPHTYTVRQYGYHPNEVALTFDDGPDPKWTPRILDVLDAKGVKGTFMIIGSEAQDQVGLMRRELREGHEIGNHTYTHPDISEISPRQLDIELQLTERLFASKLGVQPLYFRPPYSIDQEPDTDDQAAPIERIQQDGYTIIGDKIDTDDWNEHPHKSPEEIRDSVLTQLEVMKTKPQFRGSIILLHDGGGDRSATVAALPVLIDALRAHGYKIVPVSALMGKTTAEVMPKLTMRQYLRALPDSIAFSGLAFLGTMIVSIFFVGDVLMSLRLVLIGILALVDRLRPRAKMRVDFVPTVAVLVPAYNEEAVIVRTVRSVLNSDYAALRVIVIDDGSRDKTVEVARGAFRQEIAAGKVVVLTKENGGKAAALNFGLEHVTEAIYVGIDADTLIAKDAIGKLVAHFSDATIGAVAGNAKVGNRVNLWTRWQALEYITSQNFERRALNLFHVVTVVPGAIGAWRTEAVKRAHGYPINTVAEDADLTMSLLEQGLKVIYEDSSLAFTEAPIDARGLMRQRFRWSFGTLQAVWKHRAAFTRNRAMGFFALPNIVIFQMLLPLVSPFIDLMFLIGAVQYGLNRYYHPETASSASFEKLVAYFLAFMVIDFVTSALAFSLERRHPANKGDGWLLFHIWLQRFAYRQVFSVVLFKTLKRAIDGRPFNWDKLERTAVMSKATEAIVPTK